MRLTLTSFLAVCLFAASSLGQSAKWVQPTKNDVGVYKNQKRELYEQPIMKVGTNARMQVLKSTRNHYRVKVNGETGWVEKRMVAAAAKSSKTYLFEDAEVIGYLDNPTPVYIIDADDQDKDPIKLDRSFAEALRENVDRETVERQAK
ncbi:MAG: hypothetical protein GF398_12925 [Chitinivibrionales bacterium]|nr:hypothetical protein [Chitinivibrionales bacterium]